MGKLREQAEALGIEVDGRWSNGTLQRKIDERKAIAAQEEARAEEPETKVAVRLLKHHCPAGWYRVLGHYDGQEEFIADQMAPPPVPGAGLPHKIWAGTVIELGAGEARKLVENITVTMVVDRDPETKAVLGRRELRQRKPLAEAQINWAGLSGKAA